MPTFLLGHRQLACVIQVLKKIGNFSQPITGLVALNPQTKDSNENSQKVNSDIHGTS
jgi:hypothetical protein